MRAKIYPLLRDRCIILRMDTFLLRLHQRQVAHQCRAALHAINHASVSLNARDTDSFWASIQSFLTAAANISKAFWGASGKLAIQRKSLRESLGVSDESLLAKTDLRNHLEHYDERLDRWYVQSVHKNHFDFCIAPRKSIVGLDDSDLFRFFDPETKEVIFWGEHYAIQPLVDEIVALLPRAEAEGQKPHWEPRTTASPVPAPYSAPSDSAGAESSD
jgi:hypothetical protein